MKKRWIMLSAAFLVTACDDGNIVQGTKTQSNSTANSNKATVVEGEKKAESQTVDNKVGTDQKILNLLNQRYS
ncbi:hypothetical protein A4G19_06530 [Pasteurellaceae bacterium Macca]|nr:hypothetical protein [Pasteurellaceae bacterium Macca]